MKTNPHTAFAFFKNGTGDGESASFAVKNFHSAQVTGANQVSIYFGRGSALDVAFTTEHDVVAVNTAAGESNSVIDIIVKTFGSATGSFTVFNESTSEGLKGIESIESITIA